MNVYRRLFTHPHMYYSFLHIHAIGWILHNHENLHFRLNPNFVEYAPFLVETREHI